FGMGLQDGPFPEHYEPVEAPVNNILSSVQNNPIAVAKICESECKTLGKCEDFPIVATTYRVSELWQAGQMTRNLTWLVELVPDMFCEMSKTLGKKKGIKTGDKIKVFNKRGEIEAYALVTDRFQPFKLNGKVVEEVGLTWHFGFIGVGKGDSANCLTPHVGDANTLIPEFKAFLCDVKKA
ncbi:formate dehydrogenase subunit alpha, partial [candidate division WOR-3 bacterium]|nr:formate dehydrogenase subunit alpha [candidate division WOR-3 bacterium]